MLTTPAVISSRHRFAAAGDNAAGQFRFQIRFCRLSEAPGPRHAEDETEKSRIKIIVRETGSPTNGGARELGCVAGADGSDCRFGRAGCDRVRF